MAGNTPKTIIAIKSSIARSFADGKNMEAENERIKSFQVYQGKRVELHV
jgi:hypothetical protein